MPSKRPKHVPGSEYAAMTIEQLEAELEATGPRPVAPDPFRKDDPRVTMWQQAHHAWQNKRHWIEFHLTLKRQGWKYPRIPGKDVSLGDQKPSGYSKGGLGRGARRKKITDEARAKIEKELNQDV